MTFAEKLKSMRKSFGMSQEILAEKLGVSRQAVTKWETGKGMPDIDNMMIISGLFRRPLDEFLSQEKETVGRKGHLYESRTEYDIDGKKRFDIKLGGASLVKVIGTSEEKVRMCLASDDLDRIEQDFKVKIDDTRGRIDIEVNRLNGITEAAAKQSLIIEVCLPTQYLYHTEIKTNCRKVLLRNLDCEEIELTGRIDALELDCVRGETEVDCDLDMDIHVSEFSGIFALNQISATSRLVISKDVLFRAEIKGIGTSVSYEENGETVSDYSSPDAENTIELNGIKSELVISRMNPVG